MIQFHSFIIKCYAFPSLALVKLVITEFIKQSLRKVSTVTDKLRSQELLLGASGHVDIMQSSVMVPEHAPPPAVQ